MAKYLGPTSSSKRPLENIQTWFEAVKDQEWETTERSALSQASETGQIVLAAFTGHPWCMPCKLLDQEVFQTWKFLSWALGKVVLWNINDATHFQSPPSEFGKYGVFALPSVLGLSAQGSELGRVEGYSTGDGAQSWIDAFESEMGW
jgi:thiol:disulfide interchange protein